MEGLLRERGVDEAEIANTVSRLTEDGALDDERFAVRYAEDKREISGWGPERIRQSLADRGIERELVERALAAEDRDGQLSRAAAFVEERDVDLAEPAEQRRVLGALARRGFESEIAWDAIRLVERAQRPGGTSG